MMVGGLELTPVSGWGIFPETRPCVIAGPCSAESFEQLSRTAVALKEQGVAVLRAGLWKPRTHPGCFEGVGETGLAWLSAVRKETGMKVCTEVAGATHVKACLAAGIDMLWIGARTTANPFLMQEIADALRGSDIPVLVKNPVSQDIGLWIGALERLSAAGITKLGLILRGFPSVEEKKYRNSPKWTVAVEMRTRYPQLPFFCDPSHMGGDAAFVPALSQRALDLGLDGLMVESHIDPSCALSDAGQQLTPAALGNMLKSLKVRSADTQNADYRASVDMLRDRIDEIDTTIVEALAARMELSRKIGLLKKSNNVSILQASRWGAVLAEVLEQSDSLGLEREFVTKVFNAVHDASIQEQNKILSVNDKDD